MRIILTILFLYLYSILSAQNRLLDDHTLLIDTYTNATKKDVLYYRMSEAWPGLKDPATIIIDGDKLPELTGFKLMNGQAGEDYYNWHITTARIIPKPGTHVKITANADYAFCIHGLKNLTIDGNNGINLGLNGMPYPGNLIGNFGFQVHNNKPKGQVFSLSVNGNGSVTVMNTEASGGFAALRIFGNKEAEVILLIENNYYHDTMDGEGMYIGSTKELPVTKFKGVIQNNIVTRTACEGLQLQHCAGLTARNNTITATGTAYIQAFQQYQDTGYQWVCAKGTNRIQNSIIDGFASVGLNMFGGDGSAANNIVDNLIISGCRGQQIYFHKSCDTGANWILNNVHMMQSDLTYFKPFTQIEQRVYSSTPLGKDKARTSIKYNTSEPPKYINSGFDNQNIVQWRPYYASYLQAGNATVPTRFTRGEVVIDTTEGLYEFYLVLNDHITDPLKSPRYSENFARMKWGDACYPPDDLRCINYPTLGIKYSLIVK